MKQNLKKLDRTKEIELIEKIGKALNHKFLLRLSYNYFSIKNIQIQGLKNSGHLFYAAKNVSHSFLELNRLILKHKEPNSSLIVMEDTSAAHMSFRNIRAFIHEGAKASAFVIKGDRWFQLEFDNMMINMPNADNKPAIHLENTSPGGATAGAILRRITFEQTRAGAIRIEGVQNISMEHIETADYSNPTAAAFDIDTNFYGNPSERITFINCQSQSGTPEHPDIVVNNKENKVSPDIDNADFKKAVEKSKSAPYNEAPLFINSRIRKINIQDESRRPIIIGGPTSGFANVEIAQKGDKKNKNKIDLIGNTMPLQILSNTAGIFGLTDVVTMNSGTITISGDSTSRTHNFYTEKEEEEEKSDKLLSIDNSYSVFLTLIAEKNNPSVDSKKILRVDKTNKQFTVYVKGSPNSIPNQEEKAAVSFYWQIIYSY